MSTFKNVFKFNSHTVVSMKLTLWVYRCAYQEIRLVDQEIRLVDQEIWFEDQEVRQNKAL